MYKYTFDIIYTDPSTRELIICILVLHNARMYRVTNIVLYRQTKNINDSRAMLLYNNNIFPDVYTLHKYLYHVPIDRKYDYLLERYIFIKGRVIINFHLSTS